MAINFPDSPTNGDTFTANGVVYTYNATAALWDTIEASISVTVSDTAPTSPSAGDQWFNSTNGSLLIYYNDGTSSQWVGVSGPAGSDGAAGASGAPTSYANLAAFPSSGNTDGDLGFATDTKASYMWDGVAWQRLSIGNQLGPRYTTTPPSSLSLAADGATSDITAVAVDDIGFPVTYDWDAFSGATVYSASSLPPQLTGVSESNGVFTLTPSTAEANAGDFSFRVKASDGVLTTPATSSISLAFATIITIAARQTRSSNYVEPTSTGVTQFNYATAGSGSHYNYFPEGATASAAGWPTGKRYIEAKWTSTDGSFGSFMLGVGERTASHNNASTGGYLYSGTTSAYAYADNGNNYILAGNNQTSGLGAYVLNDVFTIAYDTDAEKVWFGKNGVWGSGCGDPGASGGAGFPLSYANEGYAFVVASASNSGGNDFTITWGGSDYTKPTGFSNF